MRSGGVVTGFRHHGSSEHARVRWCCGAGGYGFRCSGHCDEVGGPTDYITADTGILIPPATPEIFVGELANAMLSIAKDPEVRVKMGKAGRHRVQEFYDWRVKATGLLKIYEDIVRVNITNVKAVGT